jgi:hypothetical protein
MKKSLVVMVILVSCMGLAGTALAQDWACMVGCEYPAIKTVCYDTLLCKGEAKGACALGCGPCGPCGPFVTYSGKWLSVAKCAAVKKPVVQEKSLVDDLAKTLRLVALPCGPVCGPVACAPKAAAAPKAPKAEKKAKEKK